MEVMDRIKCMLSKEELENQGWKEASITGGQHLTRIVEMYHEMGFDTHLEEIDPQQCDTCTECFKSGGENMYHLYVRAKDEAAGQV